MSGTTRDPEHLSRAYTIDSQWRNRDLHIVGRNDIVAFLTQKWQREFDYVLGKGLWSYHGNRIAVRFQYECRDDSGQWWRSYGNELWQFTDAGLVSRREASINDVAIDSRSAACSGPARRRNAASALVTRRGRGVRRSSSASPRFS